jgi:hypothetical protein
MQGSRKEYIETKKPWVPEGPGGASNGRPKGLWQGLMAGEGARRPRKSPQGAKRGQRAQKGSPRGWKGGPGNKQGQG